MDVTEKNEGSAEDEIQKELAQIKKALVLRRSIQYFNQVVQQYQNDLAQALAIFKQEDSRSDIHLRIRQIRDEYALGANIERSPTVAVLVCNIVGISNEYYGISGKFEQNVASDLKLGAVARTHAEGRALAKLARDMKAANLTGGSAILYVDKIPCGFCKVVIPSIKKQYDVDLRVISPTYRKK